MPRFRYTGDVGRVFTGDGTPRRVRVVSDGDHPPPYHSGFEVSPGDVIEADANPDARFFDELTDKPREEVTG